MLIAPFPPAPVVDAIPEWMDTTPPDRVHLYPGAIVQFFDRPGEQSDRTLETLLDGVAETRVYGPENPERDGIPMSEFTHRIVPAKGRSDAAILVPMEKKGGPMQKYVNRYLEGKTFTYVRFNRKSDEVCAQYFSDGYSSSGWTARHQRTVFPPVSARIIINGRPVGAIISAAHQQDAADSARAYLHQQTGMSDDPIHTDVRHRIQALRTQLNAFNMALADVYENVDKATAHTDPATSTETLLTQLGATPSQAKALVAFGRNPIPLDLGLPTDEPHHSKGACAVCTTQPAMPL